MNIIDNRTEEIEAGDIVITYDDEKYLVVYETSCIAWHFVNLEYFEYNIDEDTTSIKPKVGDEIDGIGKIVSVIKSRNVDLTLG